MNTRTTNRARHAALSILGAVALTVPLVVAGKTAFAAADKAGDKNGKGDKGDADKGSDEPEKTLPPILQKALEEKEAQVTDARREAIKLLEAYLRENPRDSAGFRPKEQAEALYKLAELYWEESKEVYLEKMGRYQAAVSACHADRSECPKVPHRPPTIDLTRAQATYLQLIDQYPKFRKIDTVIYLYAFSLRDQQKIGESIKYFQIILDKYPRSRYLADAWMAIAEYRFYEQQNYKSSLEAYEKVLKYPKSTLYDLALFKTAWCYWKLGDTTKSAQRFKEVLDLAKKKAGRSEEQQKRAEELQGEALDYLVELFTEDDTKTARDAFEFLAQIGGKQYSRKVLKQLADTVFDQTRYERAVEAYRLLIELDPNAGDAPDYAGKIVEGYQLLGDIKTAVAEMRKLASDYGARSPWATANKDRPKTVEHARTMAEGLIRNLAKTMHAEAQQNEKATKVVDKDRYAQRRRGLPVLSGQLPRRARRRRAALPARRHPLLQARQVRGRRPRVPGGRQDPTGRQVPQGRAPAGDGRVRKGPQADRQQRLGRRQARDHRQRPPVRRSGRPLRDAVPQRQGDRHRHLQERPVLLRLRRLRRGGQALRPDRRALPRRPQRGRSGRPDPAGAQQGEGLRKHRELGAPAQEDQGLRPQGRAGAPRQADRRLGDEVGREVRSRAATTTRRRRSSCASPTNIPQTETRPRP